MSTIASLPAELTIYTIGELRPQWLDWLADDATPADELVLDAGAVAEVDAAGLQLLQSLHGALERRQRRLRLIGPSARLTAAASAVGLHALLGAPAGARA